MFLQALNVTFRILTFRAGPQDFPYSPRRGLTLGCIAFAVLADLWTAIVILPLAPALLISSTFVCGAALLTRMILGVRKSMNHYQQTLNALLTTTGAVALVMAPSKAAVAPLMLGFLLQAQANPDIVNQPDQWPVISVWDEVAIGAGGFWQFVVISFIYGHAARVDVLRSILLAVALIAGVFVISILTTPLVAAVAG